MLRIMGAVIGGLIAYMFAQSQGDPGGIGLWYSIGAFLFLLWWWRKKPKKFCAWCGEKSGLTKEKECEGEYVWQHANADGSQDKRIKGNFQKANYLTYLRCEECSALTVLQHRMSQRPRSSEKVIKVMLSEDGEGERTAQDWEFKRGWLERSLDEMDITGFFSGADKDLKKMKRI